MPRVLQEEGNKEGTDEGAGAETGAEYEVTHVGEINLTEHSHLNGGYAVHSRVSNSIVGCHFNRGMRLRDEIAGLEMK